jgi:hypothetical protein
VLTDFFADIRRPGLRSSPRAGAHIRLKFLDVRRIFEFAVAKPAAPCRACLLSDQASRTRSRRTQLADDRGTGVMGVKISASNTTELDRRLSQLTRPSRKRPGAAGPRSQMATMNERARRDRGRVQIERATVTAGRLD